jgi:hypothetical protein
MHLGINKQAVILAVLLLFTASVSGQSGKSVKYHFNGSLQKNDVINGNQSIIINYSISELSIDNFVNKQGSFYRISIPGHNPASIPGKPELPVYSRLIAIPEGAECKVKISEVTATRINPSKEKIGGILFPKQESETKSNQQKERIFQKDKAAYSTRGIINSDTVIIELIGTARNTRLANVNIYPVRYNPKSNILELITSMKIEITYTYSDKISSKSLLPQTTLFNESLAKGVLNYTSSDLIPGYTEQPVQMVIITDTAFKKQLQPYIRWKTQKGYKLRVLYKGIGLAGNTYTQLKDTLTKIYNASTLTDPAPEYLLIIGDTKRIPNYPLQNPYNTDMYYGEFTGNGDYIPEMFIGRLPVSDTSELKTVVSKIIQYEKFQFADTNKFYNAAAVVAGYDSDHANYMNGQIKYAVSNYLNTTNQITGNPFYYFSNLSASGALPARNDSIIKMINKGLSFINYTGHGDEFSWMHLNFTMDTARIKNKNMYPLVISNACQTARFSLPASLGNRMVLTADKGAIGFIGCSNDSYWDEDYYWSVGASTPSANPTYLTTGAGAYDRLFHTHNESASNWYFTMGQINYAGNLAVSTSTSSFKKYYWETYNLIGDPSVIPILGTPGHFNITLPDTIPNGIKTLSLNVDPFAYVAVSHFDKLWDASYSSPSGSVMLDMPGTSYDSCMVVITGQNKVPVIKTIRIRNITKEYLNLTSASINDTQGNGNGQADFGEKLYLKLKVNNLGLTGATGVYAKISSSSNWATVTKDSVYMGNIGAQSEIIVPDGLGITISGTVPDMSRITLRLILKDDKSTKSYPIDIVVHAPDLQIINCIVDDSALGNGNYIADPGETFNLIFKVRNLGSSTISGLFSVGSVNDMSILDVGAKSCTLNFGEITYVTIKAKLSETVSAGSSISVSSTLNCSQIILSKQFSFRVGRVRESFEASSLAIFPWINISAIPWTTTGLNSYDGNISARSGKIADKGSSSLIIKCLYAFADSVKFYYKVSSETGFDFLSFRLNGTEIFKKSGEIDWTKEVVAVPKGMNKMEWVYYKDGDNSSGSDCAWVDMIDFSESSAVSYIQRDLETARIVTPVQKDKSGQGLVTVKVLNVGKDIINSFNLAYEINSHTPVKQKFDNQQVIPFGDSVTVSFATKVDLSKSGIYKIVAYGYDNGDDYLLNDTLHVKIDNIEIKDSIGIYPNPFSDQFTVYINSKANDKVVISVTNISGVTLYSIERNVVIGKNTLVISDLRLFPALYYLNIRGTMINKTTPVLKIKK